MKQHKWHKEIKAWADGLTIQYKDENFPDWIDTLDPDWDTKSYIEFRIKPQPKEPQFEEYITPYADVNIIFKPQPIPSYKGDPTPTHVKKPKYLYVYLDDDYEFSPIKLNTKWTYIGKIKLEEDDK